MNLRTWRWGRWVAAAWATASAVGVAVACGSSTTASPFPDGGGSADGASFSDATKRDAGSKLHMSDGSGSHSGDGPVTSGDGGLEAACAAHTTPASVIPAYLIFVMDRSDSMKQYGKWPACSAALEAFFSDPTTAGISASLTFMPFVPDGAVDTAAKPGYSCTDTDYVTPQVPITPLPSPAFKAVIAPEKLALGTPTSPALQGALTYAAGVKIKFPKAKVLIVLATDGYPAGCTDNTVKDVAKVANVAAATDGIPVYVIGVGPDNATNQGITNLNEVAEAGATGSAFFIPTEVDGGDAGVTEQAFLDAVHQIQGSLGCNYAIPPPPAGQMLDYDKVNVVLSSGGKDTTLPYSADCSDTSGWYYEQADGGTPQKIVLCSASCKSVRATSTSSSVSVELGCTTAGGTPPK